MLCVIYIWNKSQYLKNEERYGKIIDGVPLSFQIIFYQLYGKFSMVELGSPILESADSFLGTKNHSLCFVWKIILFKRRRRQG